MNEGPPLPPLEVPLNRLAARDPNAIAVEGWLLYPTLRMYSLYSDNLFLSPISPISAGGVGVTPSLTAVWSNGIHTTTLYGNFDRQSYPTHNEVDTLDGRAGFSQRYEAMRDLIFTVDGNYSHTTWATGLQNSLQTSPSAPTSVLLSNGNTVLPNGTVISPTGQPVGQTSPASGSSIPLVVNPSNQYNGTFAIEKIFNRGIFDISGSLNRTDFEMQNAAQSSFNSKTVNEHAAFWLSPLFYVYSDGVATNLVTDATPTLPSVSTDTYRVIGGLGTRQFGLLRGSIYYGSQGSQSGNGVTGGGDVYGGAIAYYPTAAWTIVGTIDRTINNVVGSSVTNLALTLPGLTTVQVPLGASTTITSTRLASSYQITPRWFLNGLVAYTRIQYHDVPRLDNSWLFDASLRYDIWRNMSITWEYRYTNVQSNVPLASATSNFAVMGATYRF